MKYSRIFCVLIVTVGVLLRLYNINVEFHQDEVFSVQAASPALAHVLRNALQDSTHPPLHLVLLHIWMRLWGHSEVSVRALSILASALFLLLLYRVALRWMRAPSALCILCLCAVSPYFVYYGQLARPYSLATLLITLSLYLFYKSQDASAHSRYKILYGVSCAVVMYTQYMGALILVPQCAALAFPPSRTKRTILLYGLGGMVSILPWLLLSMRENFHMQGLEERIGWLQRPTLSELPGFFANILGPLPFPGRTSVFVLLSALVLLPISVKGKPNVRQPCLLIAVLAFFGPIMAFVISRSTPISIWFARQMIGPAIFFIILLGFGLDLHSRWLRGLLAALLVGWCMVALPAELAQSRQPPWRAIVALLQQKCPNCHVLMQEGWNFVDPLRYYSHRDVHTVEDYTSSLDKTKPVVFLCRPVNCDRLQDLERQVTLVESQSVHWKAQATQYTTFQIYFFTPRL
jgi:uncharacterized membrane protein